MRVGHVAPEIVLAVGAAATLLAAMFRPPERQAANAALATVTIVAAMIAAAWLGGEPEQLTLSGTWALDGVTRWTTEIILAAALATVWLCPEWFRGEPRHGELYSVLLLSALGSALVAGASDLMELIVGLLLASVTGYVLCAFHRRSKPAVEAGLKFFLLGSLANTLLLLGAVLLFAAAGSTRYAALAAALPQADIVLLAVAAGFVTVGLAFKMGAVPVHAWVPDVAEGAPAPVAAYLTTAPKAAAVIAAARLFDLLPDPGVGWRPLIAAVAAATMTLGNLAALGQSDLRRLLGWSSVSQSGYALLGVVALGRSDLALPGLVVFLVAYVFANLAAFGVVVELRGRTSLDGYEGLASVRPGLTLALGVALLSLVGIPPLAGFAGKLTLFTAAIDAGYGWLALVAVANTVVSLFYYLRVLGPAVLHRAPDAVPVLGSRAIVPVAASAVVLVVAGIGAGGLLASFGRLTLLP